MSRERSGPGGTVLWTARPLKPARFRGCRSRSASDPTPTRCMWMGSEADRDEKWWSANEEELLERRW
jgi:hypothetical protein